MFKVKKFRVVLALLIVFVLSIGVAGCGTSTKTTTAKKYNIGMTIADYTIPFQVAMNDAAVKEADKLGNVILESQNASSDTNKQIASIETFIAEKKDAIIVNPVTTDSLQTVVKKAEAAGIKVIGMNRPLGDSTPVSTFIGCDDVQNGYTLAATVSKLLGGDDKTGSVFLLQGTLGSSAQAQRYQGIEQYIKEKNVAWKIVSDASENWDQQKAMTATQNALMRYTKGNLDVILSEDPFGAIGAVSVLKSTGRTELLNKIITSDLPIEVWNAINAGDIYACTDQDPSQQGTLAIDYSVKILQGDKTIPVWYKTPLPVVDKSNTSTYKATW
jgi:ABC-type sugar transport system substrate-binding protein